ncbi:MAG: NAD(P)/FAD-dependent oxidoreductase [Chloroflexi bacterium]|nr:MAG: NAD(P)/FAD-dependent oxidoreductase [Chloroflexota bacterium]MBL1193712.1 NAD(P)/FAD-dependent oxidoreductase [Chloroflexota bacterium]NOH11005.1 NAD(P)/FAD-dependent oxidoreductase [Chloroflexota bacterium]
MNAYDVIIIGGGHNGLTTAAYLAKAGRKILVLERRSLLGGAAATEELFPDFHFNTGSSHAGLLLPQVVDDLQLQRHGLEFLDSPVAAYAPQPDGRALTLWRDSNQNPVEIAQFSQNDAEAYPQFLRLVNKLTRVLRNILPLTPPNPKAASLSDLFPWLRPALQAKGLGDEDLMEFMRIIPMTTKELLDEWFESDALKGLLGLPSVAGSMQGPQASGTAFMLLYQQLGVSNAGLQSSRFVKGGVGQVSAALAKAAQAHSAEIRIDVPVAEIIIEDGQAVGIRLEDGEVIKAKAIVSNASPRHTFFELASPSHLPVKIMRRVRNIRYRGSTAKVLLALNDLPLFNSAPPSLEHLSGHIVIASSLDLIERAYDDAKYGRISQSPVMDITIPSILDDTLSPAGKHIMEITFRYAPYNLSTNNWDKQKDELGKLAIDTLAAYAPDIKDLILHQYVITPQDYESDYGQPEGSIFHGQMGLDQLLFMRPIAGYAQYRSPIHNLYLCGAGTHPGGGLTSAPGFNAAREILRKRK